MMSKANALDVIKKIKSLPAKQQRALIQVLKSQNVDISSIETIPQRPRSQNEKIQLSFAQQRLWFLARLDGTSAYYNIPMALRLSGHLDRPALIRTLKAIVERHEVLRTRFVETEGVPYQRIDDGKGFTVSEEDLADGDDLRSICEKEAVEPFDLESESLIRVRLLRQSENE